MDRIRVMRVIEYEGPREAVEKQVANSLHGQKTIYNTGVIIRAATIGIYPEVLKNLPVVEENDWIGKNE